MSNTLHNKDVTTAKPIELICNQLYDQYNITNLMFEGIDDSIAQIYNTLNGSMN